MKLYDEIKWSGYDWYIIDIQEDSYKLLMKETLKEQDFLDDDNEMEFGETNIWRDSYIRDKLNNEFINKLNKEDMLEMTTKIRDDEEIIETNDYIRLLSINEILNDLPMKIRECDNWYWSLSPRAFGSYSRYAFRVATSGNVSYDDAIHAGSVRPVVLINKSALEKCNQKIKKLNIQLELNDENKVNGHTANNLEYNLAFKINEIIEYINKEN